MYRKKDFFKPPTLAIRTNERYNKGKRSTDRRSPRQCKTNLLRNPSSRRKIRRIFLCLNCLNNQQYHGQGEYIKKFILSHRQAPFQGAGLTAYRVGTPLARNIIPKNEIYFNARLVQYCRLF